MLINGESLPAGKYSIWAIPRPDEWTLIFSSAHDVFHVPYPGEDRDALRLRISPSERPHMETLAFHFPVAAQGSARLDLYWGEVVLPPRIRTAN